MSYGPRGYFVSDHRQGGIGPDGEKGILIEQDFVCCSHCDHVVYLEAYQLQGGVCLRCMGPICHPCIPAAARGTCTPRAARKDAAIRRR
jgi:hypothetical protein